MELKHEEDFRKWLPKNNVKKSDYAQGIKKIQEKLESDIEVILQNGLQPALDKLTPALFNNNKKLAGNAASHLKKYHVYINDKSGKIPFRKEEDFSKWLAKNGVNNFKGYVSHINSIQRVLQVDIDDFLERGLEQCTRLINERIFKNASGTLRDKKTILKKYWEFSQSKN